MQESITPYNETEPYAFVSYAHVDETEVMAEMHRLKEMGVNIWYDAGITPGSTWREEIAQSLAKARRMIFFVTRNSVSSKHCFQETSFSHTRGVKILAIHLEPVKLPLGLELSLGDQQAIFKYQLHEELYVTKLREALEDLEDLATRVSTPGAATSELKQTTVLHAQFRTVPVGDEPVDPESYLEAITQCRTQIIERIANLEGHLSLTSNKEFILQQGIGSAARYIFKHALIRDTAYGSLMKKDRHEYHKRIASNLVSHFPELSERRPELVAHHHSAVNDHQHALEWWMKAGDIATQNFANKEAEHHFNKALDSISNLDGSADSKELEILMRLVPIFVVNYGYGASELESTAERALELCERVGDDTQTGFVLFGLWMVHVVRANHPQSLELASRVAESAERMQNPDLILEAALAQGIANFFVGEFDTSRSQFEKCIALYDEETHANHAYLFGQDPRIIALAYSSWLLWIIGEETLADEASKAALKYARELDHPSSLAFALSYATFLRLFKSDHESEADFAEELVAMLETHGINVTWLAHGKVAQAWHLGAVDDAHTAAEAMRKAIQLFRDTGSRCFLPLWDAIHAEILIKAGRTDEALEILNKAKEEMAETGESWCLSELHRVHAKAHHSLGKNDHTQKAFKKAIDIAHQQGATNWLGRVETSREDLTR